jgi:hypothetical protein
MRLAQARKRSVLEYDFPELENSRAKAPLFSNSSDWIAFRDEYSCLPDRVASLNANECASVTTLRLGRNATAALFLQFTAGERL